MPKNKVLPCREELRAAKDSLAAIIDELDHLESDLEESNEQLTRLRAVNNSAKGLFSVVKTFRPARKARK